MTPGSLWSRGVALGLLFSIGIGLAYAVFAYRGTVKRLDNSIAEALETYDRFRAVATYSLADQTDAKSTEQVDVGQSIFLPGETAALTSAALQALLKEMASTNGLAVLQASEFAPKEVPGLRLQGNRLEVSGTNDAFARFIAAIARHQPALVVEGIQITSQPDMGVPANSEPILYGSIEVAGVTRHRAVELGAAP